MNLRFNMRSKIILCFLIPLVFLLILSVIAYQNITSLILMNEEVTHTYQIIAKTHRIKKLAIDIETGERGFLITGKNQFLEPYHIGRFEIEIEIAQTLNLVRNTPSQVEKLKEIADLIRQWQRIEGMPAIELRKKVVENQKVLTFFEQLRLNPVNKQLRNKINLSLKELQKQLQVTENNATNNVFSKILLNLLSIETAQHEFSLTGKENALKDYPDDKKALFINLAQLKLLLKSPQTEPFEQLEAQLQQWIEKALIPEIFTRRQTNKIDVRLSDVNIFIEKETGKVIMDKLRKKLKEFEAVELFSMQSRQKAVFEKSSSVKFILIWGTVATILITILIAIIISQIIIRPIIELLKVTQTVEQGNFNIRNNIDSKDEIGLLGSAFNKMLDSLQQEIQERHKVEGDLQQHKAQLEILIEKKVAEIKKTNQLLQEKETYLKTTLESMVDCMIVIDSKGIITSVNAAFENIFGYSTDEVLGKNIKMLMPEPNKSKHDQYLANYHQGGEGKIIGIGREVMAAKKNGSLFPLELSVSEMESPNIDGKIEKFYIGICRNIEERKKIEAQIKKSKEEAEQANQAKSEFLSKMSHELRTPLNAILGFSQLELMRDEEEKQQVDLSNIQPIKDAGEHLLALINEILDLSRIETGRMGFSIEPIEVISVLRDIYSQTESLAKRNDLSLGLALDEEPNKVYIAVDKLRLKQILLNLISNAIKYNRKHGSVTLSVQIRSANILRISVKDTGIGIDDAHIDRLFKPFDRLDIESTGIEGTGIGLALTKELTEAMHGTIGVNTQKNKGSEFYLEFSIFENATDIVSPLTEYELNNIHIDINRAVKILYIEDSQANLELVEKIFEHFEEIELISAVEPVAGLKLAKQHRPDLILLDIHLPIMDGFSVFKCLQQNAALKTIPVIAVSANALKYDIDRALNMGFYAYVVKPIDINLLCNKINEVLNRNLQ